MFDALIREISQRFGLGDKAQDLVTSLLALIFDPNSGGIQGLAAKLQQQGLGDLLSTWLSGSAGPATAISPQQIENALGSSQLSEIADKLGVARGTVVAAASAALPKIIGAVSSNGQLPTEIPASISGMLGELAGLGGAGAGVASPADTAAAASTMASAASSAASSVEDSAAGGLGWLKWLILAAIVLALGYCMMNRKAETPPAPPAAAVPAPAPAPPPAPVSAPAATQETAAPAAAAPEATPPAAATDAKAALSALTPGKFSASDLVKALNLMIVHFDTGSATISADSIDALTDAVKALKAAPPGTKVEVGGHTDNSGDAAANLKLSDERANAVRNKLTELGVAADTLSAKGYGDTKPVADNATEAGRAKNRRIEFTVQH